MLTILRPALISVFISLAAVLLAIAVDSRGQAVQTPAAGAEAQADLPSDTPADALQSWPQTISTTDATVIVYLPQIETFQGDRVSGRAAVAVTRAGAPGPTFGAMQFVAEISTDRENRTVTLIDLNVSTSQFRSADAELGKVLSDTVTNGVRQKELTFPLDELLTQLEIATHEKNSVDVMKNDPPKIIVSDVPAILVVYDGPPKLTEVEDSKLMRVANTPFMVLFDPSSKLYYLDGGRGWYSAAEAMGPWEVTDQVSKEILALQAAATQPADANPATQEDDDSPAPTIYTATEPTELIVTDGPSQMASIYNTNLLYISNTESDVFLDIMTQKVYVLLSGRWYVADRMDGVWAYVPSDKLPPDFAKIPPESSKASVLTGVAGTEAAEESVLDALIPQTATVDRSAAGPAVSYDGQPQFEAIADSTVSYAVNTPDSVLKVDNGYYCCSQGVWYQSTVATGPWAVCVSVPGAIYTIPPSCPVYPVRYVYVYSYSPTIVHVGYTPGYMGCYVYRGTVIYGTGYVYRGWMGHYYYPRPVTHGFAVAYNPYTGNWGFRVGVAGPRGWFAVGTGGVAVGGPGFVVAVGRGPSNAWWGPGGYHRHNNVNIKTGDINIDRSKNINIGSGNVNVGDRNRNIYANRPDSGKGVYTRDRPSDMRARPGDARGGDARGGNARPGDARGGDARGAIANRGGNRAGAPPSASLLPAQGDRNLFADKNGNVMRRGTDGWETRGTSNAQPGNQLDARGRQNQQNQNRGAQNRPAQNLPAQDRPAQNLPAQNRPAQNLPAQNRPAQNLPTQNQRQQRPDLDRELQARDRGQQRAQTFQQYQSRTQNAGGANRSAQPAQNRSAPQRGGGQRGGRQG